jgi:hypothetical protein
MMTDREKIIRNYINGYNEFDIDKMVKDLDEAVIFENISNGVINMSLNGLEKFRAQAEEAKNYFSSRVQTIKSYTHHNDDTEIEVDYHAVLAMDLPNGLKKGDALQLHGKSIFRFLDGKIIKLTDIV